MLDPNPYESLTIENRLAPDTGGFTPVLCFFFFSSRRRHTRLQGDWSSDVCSSDLVHGPEALRLARAVVDDPEVRPAALDEGPVPELRRVRPPRHHDGVAIEAGHRVEIGRASCRERV